MYVVTQGRKLYGLPTDFGFCIKVNWAPEVPLGSWTPLLTPCPALPNPWR